MVQLPRPARRGAGRLRRLAARPRRPRRDHARLQHHRRSADRPRPRRRGTAARPPGQQAGRRHHPGADRRAPSSPHRGRRPLRHLHRRPLHAQRLPGRPGRGRPAGPAAVDRRRPRGLVRHDRDPEGVPRRPARQLRDRQRRQPCLQRVPLPRSGHRPPGGVRQPARRRVRRAAHGVLLRAAPATDPGPHRGAPLPHTGPRPHRPRLRPLPAERGAGAAVPPLVRPGALPALHLRGEPVPRPQRAAHQLGPDRARRAQQARRHATPRRPPPGHRPAPAAARRQFQGLPGLPRPAEALPVVRGGPRLLAGPAPHPPAALHPAFRHLARRGDPPAVRRAHPARRARRVAPVQGAGTAPRRVHVVSAARPVRQRRLLLLRRRRTAHHPDPVPASAAVGGQRRAARQLHLHGPPPPHRPRCRRRGPDPTHPRPAVGEHRPRPVLGRGGTARAEPPARPGPDPRRVADRVHRSGGPGDPRRRPRRVPRRQRTDRRAPLERPDLPGVDRSASRRGRRRLHEQVALRRPALRPRCHRPPQPAVLHPHRAPRERRLGDRTAPRPLSRRVRPRPHRGGQRHR
ncbi:basic proline-rich protein precursor [Streptomyces sp. NL15-2K]|nr:basic proline-rich protein precursor [Streptomyces sp. NL15-2K]